MRPIKACINLSALTFNLQSIKNYIAYLREQQRLEGQLLMSDRQRIDPKTKD